jgi:competence protein ComFC
MSRLLPKAWPVLKSALDALLGFFYPEVCQYCGEERATADGGYIGAVCRENAKFIEPPICERCGLPFAGSLTSPFSCSNCRGKNLYFRMARSAVVAKGMVLDLLHRYKYKGALWVEPFLADLLIRAAGERMRMEHWDLIVPVPLHPAKQREREFNQAERLARRLGQATGIPVCRHALRRVRPTTSQTRLSREARAANVRQAFALHKPAGIQGKRIVIVDDVFTTGATTSACARLLKQARAKSVCVWTVARGLMN